MKSLFIPFLLAGNLLITGCEPGDLDQTVDEEENFGKICPAVVDNPAVSIDFEITRSIDGVLAASFDNGTVISECDNEDFWIHLHDERKTGFVLSDLAFIDPTEQSSYSGEPKQRSYKVIFYELPSCDSQNKTLVGEYALDSNWKLVKGKCCFLGWRDEHSVILE